MRKRNDTRTARLLVALALAAAFVQDGSGAPWALENEAREVERPELARGLTPGRIASRPRSGARVRLCHIRQCGPRGRGAPHTGADVPYRRGETVDLVAGRSVKDLVDSSSNVELEIGLIEQLPDSASGGTWFGMVVARVDGQKIRRARWSPGRATGTLLGGPGVVYR